MKTKIVKSKNFTPNSFFGDFEKRLNAFAIIFIACCFFWHWLGPISGQFDLSQPIHILTGEYRGAWAWPLTLLIFVSSAISRNNFGDWLRHSPKWQAAFIVVAFLFIFSDLGGARYSWSNLCFLVFVFLLTALSDLNNTIPRLISALVGFSFFSYSFTVLKMTVFMQNRNFDDYLVAIDNLLGLEWVRINVLLIAHDELNILTIADLSYQLIFPMVFAFAVAAAVEGSDTFVKYKSSLFFVYAFGALIYVLLPAWGPFVGQEFKNIAPHWGEGGWRVAEIQKIIMQNSLQIKNRNYFFEVIPAYGFVAAMPSLHVATPAVAFFIFKEKLGLVKYFALIALIVSAWSALVTGMHYFIDLIAGYFLAYFAVNISKKFLNENP